MKLHEILPFFQEQYPVGCRVAFPRDGKESIVGNIVDVTQAKNGNIVARVQRDDQSFRMFILDNDSL